MSSRLVTARKRSLGQGKVFTHICHSVHFLGRRPRKTPPKQIPPRQTPLLGRHTLVQIPPDRYALGRHSPLGRHPLGRHPQADSPGQTPPGRHTPLGKHTAPGQTPPLGKQCPWADTPLGRHPQTPRRAVRILMECILL